MEPTSLSHLLNDSGITCVPDGLIITIHPSWIIEHEDRLSYTTLIRLIECCRELHWNQDIMTCVGDVPIDSIVKSISGEFIRPILVETKIKIAYQVNEVRKKSYLLSFLVYEAISLKQYAKFQMICVFYDPQSHIAIEPPQNIINHLENLVISKETGSYLLY